MDQKIGGNTLSIRISDAHIESVEVSSGGSIQARVALLVNGKTLSTVTVSNQSWLKDKPEFLKISSPDQFALSQAIETLYSIVRRSAILSLERFAKALPEAAETL